MVNARTLTKDEIWVTQEPGLSTPEQLRTPHEKGHIIQPKQEELAKALDAEEMSDLAQANSEGNSGGTGTGGTGNTGAALGRVCVIVHVPHRETTSNICRAKPQHRWGVMHGRHIVGRSMFESEVMT